MFWIALSLLAFLFWPGGLEASDSTGYAVRLCVSAGSDRVEIRTDTAKMLDGDVRDVLAANINGSVMIFACQAGLKIAGLSHEPRSVILSSANSFRIGKRVLVGEIEISRDPKGKLLVVNYLSLEKYLMGILVAEMSPSWPVQALRAQAVASRTYAVHRVLSRQSKSFDLSSTTLDQVYAGIANESQRVIDAVTSTKGQVLVYGNVPTEALFHSCCGGRTRSAESVFGNPVPYLIERRDENCVGCPKEEWKVRVSIEDIGKRLNHGRRAPLKIVTVRHAGRLTEFVIHGQASIFLSNHKLRQLIGARVLLSPGYTWKKQGSSMYFQGRGNGHGVGMCQWGARRMAERGADYKQILFKYYPGCKLRAMY